MKKVLIYLLLLIANVSNAQKMYEEFDTNGLIIKRKVIGDHTQTFYYDKKNKMIRWNKLYDNTEIEWKLFTYGKDNFTTKHRLRGNPPVIHKETFVKNEEGDFVLLFEKFL
jgi:hypothetical protein